MGFHSACLKGHESLDRIDETPSLAYCCSSFICLYRFTGLCDFDARFFHCSTRVQGFAN